MYIHVLLFGVNLYLSKLCYPQWGSVTSHLGARGVLISNKRDQCFQVARKNMNPAETQ